MAQHSVARTLLAAAIATCFNLSAYAQDRSERNLSIMLGAGRQLDFAPDNQAYLLVKRTTLFGAFSAPVAVVFGYVDNHDACGEIAEALVAIAVDGAGFECDAIR